MSGPAAPRGVGGDRKRQLQRNYDVHEHQCGRCILAPKRRGCCPMPMAEEVGALLMARVSQSVAARRRAVEQECDNNGQRAPVEGSGGEKRAWACGATGGLRDRVAAAAACKSALQDPRAQCQQPQQQQQRFGRGLLAAAAAARPRRRTLNLTRCRGESDALGPQPTAPAVASVLVADSCWMLADVRAVLTPAPDAAACQTAGGGSVASARADKLQGWPEAATAGPRAQ
ncbi:hypothetical protein P154DRAFT_581018 [Amniculicola lignicola CBS 123094]|uniref:Uncharacterized protein n=1 Tax=Amniculicola lignicola CBS 123094 TaxID=1392246 RepID=A0A6A5W244_9PLEO|nr:hypothetical protein P154DRAFT_581018 [Amniculicola lignicola CBS 123094]